jgi:hypothetical protein
MFFLKKVEKNAENFPHSIIIVWSIEANVQSGFPRRFN